MKSNWLNISLGVAVASVGLLGGPATVSAQTFPNRPVRIVVPYPAGGSMDLIARLIAAPMARVLGQPVIVEDRAGAAGQLASAMVARAEPDGYTLLLSNPGPSAVAFAINPKLGYNPAKDFSPISLAASMPMVITVGANSRYQSIGDLVDAAKAQPGKLNYATTGTGSLSHVVIELFNGAAGINVANIPYKGGGEITTAAMTGDVDYFAAAPSDVLPLVRSGKLRAIGTTGALRSPLMPDIPTVAEAGLSSFEVVYWVGLLAPARTPDRVIALLHGAVDKAVSSADIKQKMGSFMAQASASSPEQLQAIIQADIVKWTKVVQSANIKIE